MSYKFTSIRGMCASFQVSINVAITVFQKFQSGDDLMKKELV